MYACNYNTMSMMFGKDSNGDYRIAGPCHTLSWHLQRSRHQRTKMGFMNLKRMHTELQRDICLSVLVSAHICRHDGQGPLGTGLDPEMQHRLLLSMPVIRVVQNALISLSKGTRVEVKDLLAGPRQCIGQSLARIMHDASVAQLLCHFSLELAPRMGGPEGVDRQEINRLTLQPGAGVPTALLLFLADKACHHGRQGENTGYWIMLHISLSSDTGW